MRLVVLIFLCVGIFGGEGCGEATGPSTASQAEPSAPASAPAQPASYPTLAHKWCAEIAPVAEIERIFGMRDLVAAPQQETPEGVAGCEYAKEVHTPGSADFVVQLQLTLSVDCRNAMSLDARRGAVKSMQFADMTSYRDLAIGSGGASIAGARLTGHEQRNPYHYFLIGHDRLPCTLSGLTQVADVDKNAVLANLLLMRLTESTRPP